jgi:maltose 6'-phosphate phosphatase
MIRAAALAAVLLALLPRAASGSQAVCADTAARGRLNVLTINLLFTEIQQRDLRLERIADFVRLRSQTDPVDAILLQEVVGGRLAGTTNSSVDLQRMLAALGESYNLSYRLANGIPGLLTVGNAVLSRCEIVRTVSKMLPVVTEEPFPGLDLEVPLSREALLVRLHLPGYGDLNVYNTHLCAFCDPVTERLQQAEALLSFVSQVQKFFPAPVVLGGDFNTDLEQPGHSLVYNTIAAGGFVDTYAALHSCNSCCSAAQGLAGCTYAVPGNPYANQPPFSTGPPARIDYIFLNGLNASSSTVVFNTAPDWVSDHSGVLTGVALGR